MFQNPIGIAYNINHAYKFFGIFYIEQVDITLDRKNENTIR